MCGSGDPGIFADLLFQHSGMPKNPLWTETEHIILTNRDWRLKGDIEYTCIDIYIICRNIK